MKRKLCAWFILCLLVSLANAEDFSGKCVGVIDGDTLQVLHNGVAEKIRLDGIDAPESNQPFGNQAKQALSSLALGKVLNVKDKGKDHFGRALAIVIDHQNNYDINGMLVRNGFAWHDKQYSNDPKLVQYETLAKQAKLGLWKDPNPISPWEFRKVISSPENPGVNKSGANHTIVYITKTGKKYHTKYCVVVDENSKAIPLAQCKGQYTPCLICKPPVVSEEEPNMTVIPEMQQNVFSLSDQEKQDRENKVSINSNLYAVQPMQQSIQLPAIQSGPPTSIQPFGEIRWTDSFFEVLNKMKAYHPDQINLYICYTRMSKEDPNRNDDDPIEYDFRDSFHPINVLNITSDSLIHEINILSLRAAIANRTLDNPSFSPEWKWSEQELINKFQSSASDYIKNFKKKDGSNAYSFVCWATFPRFYLEAYPIMISQVPFRLICDFQLVPGMDYVIPKNIINANIQNTIKGYAISDNYEYPLCLIRTALQGNSILLHPAKQVEIMKMIRARYSNNFVIGNNNLYLHTEYITNPSLNEVDWALQCGQPVNFTITAQSLSTPPNMFQSDHIDITCGAEQFLKICYESSALEERILNTYKNLLSNIEKNTFQNNDDHSSDL